MIKGLILYTEKDAKKNKWFIEHMISIAKSYDINLVFYTIKNQNFSDTELLDGIDFCINRTRHCFINNILNKMNIRCYNNWDSVRIFNDKWFTFLLCSDIGIPVIDTVKIDSYSDAPFDYPFVIKGRNGHGGNEVFRVDNEQDLKSFDFSNPSGYIAQKFVSDPGTDVRIYVMGDEPIAAVKRSSDCDFRSNFSLGGKAEIFTPTDEQLSVIKKIRNIIPTDYAGFDFILHNGKWILNEVEDVVGSRMLYSLFNYDVGESFIKYIREDLKARGL